MSYDHIFMTIAIVVLVMLLAYKWLHRGEARSDTFMYLFVIVVIGILAWPMMFAHGSLRLSGSIRASAPASTHSGQEERTSGYKHV